MFKRSFLTRSEYSVRPSMALIVSYQQTARYKHRFTHLHTPVYKCTFPREGESASPVMKLQVELVKGSCVEGEEESPSTSKDEGSVAHIRVLHGS